MSFFGTDLRDAGLGLASRVRAGVAGLRRITAAVALLRLIVAGSLVVASALALPVSVTLTRTFLLFIGLAVAAALAPRTHAVSVALVTIVGLWAVLAQDRPLWRILALAAVLYVAHASAAFAAVLPLDCAVAASALRGWVMRTAFVVSVSVALGGGGLVMAGQVPFARGVVGPVVGALIAAGIALVLAWQLRRPRERQADVAHRVP
jgi:hypothetical protein